MWQSTDWDKKVALVWDTVHSLQPAELIARIAHLAEVAGDQSAAACFEQASAHDYLGEEATAIPLYERALQGNLDDSRREQAIVQLASSLRNTGRPGDAETLLDSLPHGSTVGLAPQAFRALAVFDTGDPVRALQIALLALAKASPMHSGAIARYAGQIDSTKAPNLP